ncbi:MAG: hypothetical protein AAF770_01815 [Bacteroidota bacterium]
MEIVDYLPPAFAFMIGLLKIIGSYYLSKQFLPNSSENNIKFFYVKSMHIDLITFMILLGASSGSILLWHKLATAPRFKIELKIWISREFTSSEY